MNAPDGVGTAPPRVRNLPNALTIVRLLLVPVFAWLLVASQSNGGLGETTALWLAALVFAIASATDIIDGDLARRRGQVTSFGKVADPIADKTLTGAALIGLSWLGELPWWVTVVVMVREIGVTILRLWVLRYGVIAASRGGKLKTALLSLAILLYLVPLPVESPLANIVMALAVVVTLVTGADYTTRALRLRRGARTASA